MSCASFYPNIRRILGTLRTANLNSTADQAIGIDATKYIITAIYATNASTTPTLAAGGLYTAASKGGTLLVGTAQLYTALSSASKYMTLTLQSVVGTDARTESTLYFSLTTANGSALTADIFIEGIDLGA